jgi:hypothetical protein
MLEPEQVQVQLQSKYQTLLVRLHQHVDQYAGPLALQTEEQDLIDEWLWNYATYHKQARSSVITFAEWLYVVQNYFLAARLQLTSFPRLDNTIAHILWDTSWRIRLWAIQHPQYQVSWPSVTVINETMLTLSKLTVFHAEELEQLQEPTDVQLPAAIAAMRQLETMQQRNETPEAYAKRPAAQIGSWWPATWQQHAIELVSVANRVMRRVMLDETLLHTWPVRNSPYNAMHYCSMFHAWMNEALSYDPTDAFLRQCHSMLTEACLPLGSREEFDRQVVDAPWDATDLCEAYYGTYATAIMQQDIVINLRIIAQDRQHVWYQHAALLAMDYMLSHTYQNVYLFPHGMQAAPQILLTNSSLPRWYAELHKRKRLVYEPRRPIIVQLRQQWYVHDAQHWLLCEHAIHAIVTWLALLRDKYNCSLESDVNLSTIINQVVPSASAAELHS